MFQYNTKLANFLASAYGLPTHVSAKIFDSCDTFDERNSHIVFECIRWFLYSAYDIDVLELDDEAQMEIFDEHWEEFLANAVLLHCEDE